MRNIHKAFVQIIYLVLGVVVVMGSYILAERFIPKPWPGILSASVALLMNETIGRCILRKLWGISIGSIFDSQRKQ